MDPLDAPDDAVRRAVIAGRDQQGHQGTGRLGELAAWLAACRGDADGLAETPRHARLVIFSRDPAPDSPAPVASAPDSAALSPAGPARALAAAAQVGVRVVAVGSAVRAADAVELGADAADAEVDAGADLLLAAETDPRTTDAAAAVVASLTGREPVALVGVAPGPDGRLDDAEWMRRVVEVRDRLRRARPAGRDPIALLAHAGSLDLAALVGFLARAARRRTPVVLDGTVSLAAALLADLHTPGARSWWLAGTRSPDPAARHALEVLGLHPVVDLGVRDGGGTGALTAVCVLRAATALTGSHGA